MHDDREGLFGTRLGRRDFLRLGALAAGTGILTACGGEEEEEAAPAEETAPAAEATTEAAAPATTEAAEPARPSIEEEPGKLHVYEWAGYEIPDLYKPYLDAGYEKPKFTFFESSQQALAKIRAGFSTDVVHPCNSYVEEYVETGKMQPWDPALLSNFPDLNPTLAQGHGVVDGQQYYVPLDWGYDSVMYRADKVEPEEESYNLLYDERYAGKISWWDDLYSLIIGGLALGVADPWEMTDSELEDVKKFLIEKKKVVRKFWASQTELDQDFQSGNIWIVGDAWGGSWAAAKAKGIDAVYMDPKEGRISWTCGLMLFADTENYYHAHEYVNAWASVQTAEWIIPNYAYGHTNTKVDTSKIDPQLVEAFSLDDPTAIEEERLDKRVPRRSEYAKAWDEVKAA